MSEPRDSFPNETSPPPDRQVNVGDPERAGPAQSAWQPGQPVWQPGQPSWQPGQPAWQAAPAARQSRAPVYLAMVLVAVLSGAALFVSGFSLGRLAGATPGTSESRQELFRPFWDAYNDISINYVGELDERKLVEGAIKGVFDALADPYSGYMTEEEYRRSLSGVSGEFEGIGAEMTTRDSQDEPCATISPSCRLIVTRIIRGSPALRAGLLADDVVLAVDGTPTLDSSLELVIPLIRGPKGTTVTLTIERAGEPIEMPIQRDVIQREDVLSETLAGGRVGYVKVAGFSAAAAADLRAQLSTLIDGGVTALILDLRDDPGGYVQAAKQVSSEFVATGPLFWEESTGDEPVAAQPDEGGVATDPSLSMVVLVNGGTASASEIVAAALQGNGRAQLVGERTFGKGTIQEFKELPGAGGYRLSVRKWLTPDQTWIHGVGLTPDVVVTEPAEPDPGVDVQLDRAIELVLENVGPTATPLAVAVPGLLPQAA
jgi:carboxyl-terminal processing protease